MRLLFTSNGADVRSFIRLFATVSLKINGWNSLGSHNRFPEFKSSLTLLHVDRYVVTIVSSVSTHKTNFQGG